MRYAIKCGFDGTGFFGWQSQRSKNTVQDTIENALRKRLGKEIQITGCCRTDSGVHASDFVFHFDHDTIADDDFMYSINKMLPDRIVLFKKYTVSEDFHSRFNAVSRSYKYHIHSAKSPFKNRYNYFFPLIKEIDIERLNEFALKLMKYEDFATFGKSKSDVKTTICNIQTMHWEYNPIDDDYIFSIKADRFLRGMVRLMVGMFLNLGLKKIGEDEIIYAMKVKTQLKMNWSVPANGLFLNEVKYSTLD